MAVDSKGGGVCLAKKPCPWIKGLLLVELELSLLLL